MTRVSQPPALSIAGALWTPRDRSAWWFAGIALSLAAVSMALAGWVPLGFSIVAVFLFAGPHNWFEFRYFLTRMPARWGPRRGFFTLGIVGAFGLAGLFALQTFIGQTMAWTTQTWLITTAAWSSALVLWVAAMVRLRFADRVSRAAVWCWPVALGLVAIVWAYPLHWSIMLVYLHPLVAMWFLHSEIKRRKPQWLGAYYVVLAGAGLMLVALWARLAGSPDLPGADALSLRITHHAGAGVLTGVSTHLLVATHVFMEMLHYAVWLIAIPLVSVRRMPWNLTAVPLAKKSARWRRAIYAVMALGLLVIVVLWIGFAADYPLTRDVYFTIAILHVLAEFPFVIRSM